MGKQNQHYVPQFLLRNFCAGGKVYIFDKTNQRIFHTNPKNVMSEIDYNIVELKNKYLVDFEAKFTALENAAKPVFDSIIENKSINQLTNLQLAALCCFVAVQHLRSKATREAMNDLPRHLREQFPEIETNDAPNLMTDEMSDRFFCLKFAIEEYATLAEILCTKHICICELKCAGNLYISDNPLVMHNNRDFGPYGNLGFAVPGIELYLPISPKIVLAFFCRTIEDEHERSKIEIEKSLAAEKMEALKSGAFTSAKFRRRIKDYKDQLQQCASTIKSIINEQYISVDSEFLLYLNSLQISSSHRFIACKKNDYNFAKAAIKNYPTWQQRPKFRLD